MVVNMIPKNEEELSLSLDKVDNHIKGLLELRQQCESPVYQNSLAVVYEELENTLDEILFDEIAVTTSTGKYSVLTANLEGSDIMGGNWGHGQERFDREKKVTYMTEDYGVYKDIEIDRIEEGPIMGLNATQIHQGNRSYLKSKLALRQIDAMLAISSRVESTPDKLNDPAKDPIAILQHYSEKCLLPPNLIIMSQNTFRKIKANPNTKEALKFKTTNLKDLLESELSATLYIPEDLEDNRVLGDMVILTRKNSTIGKPKAAAVFMKNVPFLPMEPSWGQKVGKFVTRNIPMPEYKHNGGVRMKTSWEYEAKILDENLYFVIKEAIDPSLKYSGSSVAGNIFAGSPKDKDSNLASALMQMASSNQEIAKAVKNQINESGASLKLATQQMTSAVEALKKANTKGVKEGE